KRPAGRCRSSGPSSVATISLNGAIRPAGPDGEADGARPSRTTGRVSYGPSRPGAEGRSPSSGSLVPGKWAGARPQGTQVRRTSLRHSRTAPPEKRRGTRAGRWSCRGRQILYMSADSVREYRVVRLEPQPHSGLLRRPVGLAAVASLAR